MTWPKWRVERCGALTHGYLPGWIAIDGAAERGAVFPTFVEAITFAAHHARAEFERDSKRALVKLGSRGVPAAGLSSPHPAPSLHHRASTPPKHADTPKRRYRRVSVEQLEEAIRLRQANRSWREIGDAVGVNPETIRLAVIRAFERAGVTS